MNRFHHTVLSALLLLAFFGRAADAGRVDSFLTTIDHVKGGVETVLDELTAIGSDLHDLRNEIEDTERDIDTPFEAEYAAAKMPHFVRGLSVLSNDIAIATDNVGQLRETIKLLRKEANDIGSARVDQAMASLENAFEDAERMLDKVDAEYAATEKSLGRLAAKIARLLNDRH